MSYRLFKIILLDNTLKLWDHSLAWYDASLGRWRSPVQIRLIPLPFNMNLYDNYFCKDSKLKIKVES